MKKILLLTVPMIFLFSQAIAATLIVEFSGNVVRPVTLTVGDKVYRDVLLPYCVFVKKINKIDTPVKVEASGYTMYETVIEKVPKYSISTLPVTTVSFAGMIVPVKKLIVNLDMKKIGDSTVSAGGEYERVTRDNPGGTSLEGTVVRWFFDSEPRGARIFWRVVSNAPQEVKNTNELYLGTIPYEETRSFNIQGLTYENSHNVQIEIKVTKQGYEDQIKRFNVRQAIDQQEISGFFDMVAKPNDM